MRAALLALALTTGCAGRTILSVEDGPGSTSARTTVLSTVESFSIPGIYTSAKMVFWECGESGGGLVCRKTCDVKDDEGDKLLCRKLTAF